MNIYCDMTCNMIALCLSVLITCGGMVTAVAFGIMACIPDGKYFPDRNIEVCVWLLVPSVTVIGPMFGGLIIYWLIYGLLVTAKYLFEYGVSQCGKLRDRCDKETVVIVNV